MNKRPITILLADDDLDDQAMTLEALSANRLANPVRCVENGQDLMDYLHHRGRFTDPDSAPTPGLILLDLNMPRKDGREVLAEMKADATLRHIPVVVLTTSKVEEDVLQSYELGANSFTSKPVTFEGLVTSIRTLTDYWFDVVVLPREAK